MELYASKVIAVAMNEVGYLEKRTNAQLYDKTANAGTTTPNTRTILTPSIRIFIMARKTDMHGATCLLIGALFKRLELTMLRSC